ncbi:cytochrome P450 [Irpex lacteus]|nr:cytochrome P450 [Irpex lacteus]
MDSLSISFALFICAFFVHLGLRKRQKLPLPPGPPGEPLIGHLRKLPDDQNRAEVFYEWSLKYGDVFSLRVPGKTMIVLNSEKAAVDLLEKRGAIYSDRVRLGYYDTIDWGDTIVFSPYTPFHHLQRKLYHQSFGKHVVSEYWPVQEREANILLKGLQDHPKKFDKQVERFSGGVVSDIGFGHRIESFDDDYFRLSEQWARVAHEGSRTSLLDLHPIFARLPSWFPGAWFVNFIKETKPAMDAIGGGNYYKVEQEMERGSLVRPSYTSKHLEAMYRGELSPELRRAIRKSGATIFAAGAETTWSTTTMFIACMLLHPEAQQKAQEEIDRVVGRDRLPEFSDRDSLPFVTAVVYESFRWQPVLPLGLPHQSMADDVYNGMFIPKGSIIIANSRSITWDPRNFHDPQTFKPERYLPKPEGEGEIFPMNSVFGWGRRICAGRHLAFDSVWIAVARILATFTISAIKDADGNLVKPQVQFTTALTR